MQKKLKKLIIKICNNKKLINKFTKIKYIKKYLWLFIKFFQKKIKKIKLKKHLYYTGTGGDKKNTFNISTISSILLSFNSIPIIKIGSKKRTSKCGSLDIFNFLYKNYTFKNLKEKIKFYKKNKLAIFSINDFIKDPILKCINNKRKKKNTIFNYVFPLLKISNTNIQIIGVNNILMHNKIAKILIKQKIKRGAIISSFDNMDELSIFNNNFITEVYYGKIIKYKINSKNINIYENKKYFKKIQINNIFDSIKIFKDILFKKNIFAFKTLILNMGFIIYFLRIKKNIIKSIILIKRYFFNKKVINFYKNVIKNIKI
ncbi:hypothetical protein ACT2CR_00150 [Candidatus Vidania fulgoroideorum]